MHLLLSMALISGSAVVVLVGTLSVIRDLLALTNHRPPEVFDELREDDQESETERLCAPESGWRFR
jgi:hypothetical protein